MRRRDGASSRSIRSRRSSATRFRAAGFELYLVGGVVRDRMPAADQPPRTSTSRRRRRRAETTRVLRGWADRSFLVGVRFGTVGARKGDRQLRDHDVPRGGLRRGAPQAGGDVREGHRDRPVAARLHDQRDGRPAAGRRVRRSVRRREAPRGQDTRHAARAGGRVLGRSAADAARRSLRRRSSESTPAPRVVEAIATMRERLEIVSAERIRDELDKLLVGRRAGGRARADRRYGPGGRVPARSSPALQLEQDPVHHHKDVLRHTYAVVEQLRAGPGAAAGRHCCTTSASRRRARSRPTACSSTITRSWARGWPRRACRRCATPTRSVDDVGTLDRAAPAVPRVRRGMDRLPPCAGTCATRARCSIG